jgi:ubiquitin-conjugating enzyme E2 Z
MASKVTSDSSKSGFISPDTVKRIASDVKDIMRSPIENCMYVHDPKNIMRGYAIVLGTEDTPYNCVPMLYAFEFPEDYPHSPPKLTFKSYKRGEDKNVRLHPNYYVNGKCCLSILNTWRGEPWSGCQTIRSVLTTIQMTLTPYPLENEPGVDGKSRNGMIYRAMIYSAGLNMIQSFLQKETMTRITSDDEVNKEVLNSFRKFLANHLKGKAGDELLQSLRDKSSKLSLELSEFDKKVWRSFYMTDLYVNYSEICDSLCSLLPKIIAEN